MFTSKNKSSLPKSAGIAVVIVVILMTSIFLVACKGSDNAGSSDSIPIDTSASTEAEENEGVESPAASTGEESAPIVNAAFMALDGGDNPESVVANSAIICIGTVLDQKSEIEGGKPGEGGVIFTDNTIRIDRIISMNKKLTTNVNTDNGVTVILRQTGGSYEGATDLAFTEDPLLENGKQYLLFLQDGDSGKRFIPTGGRYGSALLEDGKIELLSPEAQRLFDIKEKSDLDKMISNIVSLAANPPKMINPSDIVINKEDKPAKEFILQNR